MRVAWSAWLAVLACTPVERPRPIPELRLIVSEAWNGGTRLVLVDERGDRWAILTAGRADGASRDEQAAVSPDGRWVAFVSSRGRTIDATSLWVVPAAVGATATRVTDGTGDDVDPTWTPDGAAVVFARRTGARFGLARVAIAGAPGALAVGPVEVLTDGVGHHLAPSVGDHGDIAYQEIDPVRGDSRIAVRAPDGGVAFVTDGPLDVTPAWRPGTRALVFARGAVRDDGRRDLDLWWLDDDAGAPRPLVELPDTDDSGPRWSRDGRWLFATAVAHDEDGALPSVVYLDAAEPRPTARMLRDAVGAIARQGPAPMPVALDAAALAGGPAFAAALAAALDERAIARAAVDAGVGDASAADAGL